VSFAHAINFAELMAPVAQRLLGEPNPRLSKPPKDLRYGTHGSLSINLETGTFFDHEANIGGGVVEFVGHKLSCDRGGSLAWMRREGLLPDRPTRSQFGKEKPKPPFETLYDYTDENGALLSQTVRYPKGTEPRFRQRRPGERHGEWVWNLEGIRRVLYHLPDVIKAIADNQTIFVVEGEKDADNLRDIGLTATTNPMGANKWRPEYSESLRGGDIVIIGDNDKPGREHVEHVSKDLSGIAKRLRVLDLTSIWPECPEKGDVSDWLAAGGTDDKLKAAVENLPDWRPLPSFGSFVWPEMEPDAYHGLAGDVVAAFEPHTEADSVAILLQVLTYFGNVVGRNPYYAVGATKHHANLFSVLVGESARGRKGTAADCARQVFTTADPLWLEGRLKGGLSSGEGLINEVRDARKEWNRKEKCEEIVDPGIIEKRLVVEETEFAGALAVMERHGNNLSPNLRKAWDGATLSTMTRSANGLTATGAHISVVGHITITELRARLTRTEAASGFANRFLFPLVRKSKSIPFPENPSEAVLVALRERIKKAAEYAKSFGAVTMTAGAREMWKAVYPVLTEGRPGLLGAVVSRSEAQTVRVAMIYALLDGVGEIDTKHLKAGLAVSNFCEESAVAIFGDSLGDEVADDILAALRRAEDGMTRTRISELFGRNLTSFRLGTALGLLMSKGFAECESVGTRGRAAETWFAVKRGTK
jgi:hypothetical protein